MKNNLNSFLIIGLLLVAPKIKIFNEELSGFSCLVSFVSIFQESFRKRLQQVFWKIKKWN